MRNNLGPINKDFFGPDFKWGVATAAYQIEGAYNLDGKGPSIWDAFTAQKGKVKHNENGQIACDFYHRWPEDVSILSQLNIPNYRFSPSWSRILPQGKGLVNEKGVDFYHRIIDALLEEGITPWITTYHWDLPLTLEKSGGWTHRDILPIFEEWVALLARKFGDRVKNWIVINEPMVFTGAGYFLGYHAPGKRGFGNFLPTMLHATLAMGAGGRVIKALVPNANVGTSFSCSHIQSHSSNQKDIDAAQRIDALLNRLYLEPILGLGFPLQELKALSPVEKYLKPNDEANFKFNFDFIGVQNYTREVVKHSWLTPYLKASLVSAAKREKPQTLMGWEVWPESLYHMLKQFRSYAEMPPLMVTENGAAFSDIVSGGQVNDFKRVQFLNEAIHQMAKAKAEGVNVKGYFVWTFTDNFEWAEGFLPRFGLVHIDFHTQKRRIKESGYWYSRFLSGLEQATLTPQVASLHQ